MGQAHQQSVHVTGTAEWMSVLMDGELAPHDVDDVLALAKSNDGMSSWGTYQLIGDALRSEELTHAGSTDAFLSCFASRLEAEPHVLAPAAANRHRLLVKPSWMRRVVPGTAIAAAVAAVSWVVVPQMRSPGDAGAPDAVVAQAAAPVQATAAKAGGIVTVAAESQMIRDPRLDEYLRAHRTSVTTDGFGPTLRTVANGANFSQDNSQE
jgi:sigma-E factor negative regulatory protein RseA